MGSHNNETLISLHDSTQKNVFSIDAAISKHYIDIKGKKPIYINSPQIIFKSKNVKIDDVVETLDNYQKEISKIKTLLATMSLETSISSLLEPKIAKLETTIETTIEAKSKEIETNVETNIETRSKEIETNIETKIETKISTLEAKISTLEATISTLKIDRLTSNRCILELYNSLTGLTDYKFETELFDDLLKPAPAPAPAVI